MIERADDPTLVGTAAPSADPRPHPPPSESDEPPTGIDLDQIDTTDRFDQLLLLTPANGP